LRERERERESERERERERERNRQGRTLERRKGNEAHSLFSVSNFEKIIIPGWLNEAAAREVLLATTTESSPSEALSGGARALKVAQATLGPAAGDVAADGADGLDAFEGAYGSQASFFLLLSFFCSLSVSLSHSLQKIFRSLSVMSTTIFSQALIDGLVASADAPGVSAPAKMSSSSSGSKGSVDVASFAAKKEGANKSRRLLAFA